MQQSPKSDDLVIDALKDMDIAGIAEKDQQDMTIDCDEDDLLGAELEMMEDVECTPESSSRPAARMDRPRARSSRSRSRSRVPLGLQSTKARLLSKALSEWRKQHNVNSVKIVEELKKKVEGLYADDNATTEEIAAALKELSDALKAEEMFGNRKARYENGNIVEDEEGLVAIATSYFRQIFESSNPEDIEEALAQVPTTITGAMNDNLTSPYSGCGWVWRDSGGNIQLLGTKNFNRRESALHSEVEALRWAMENMLQHSTCQNFGTDCKELIAMIKNPYVWPSFATELERIETLLICFPDFNIIHVPRARNQFSDFLAKTARSFHRKLHFIGYSIPVWLPSPPQT
ncbi:hypothetical protein F2Q69_00034630 [Brassica cretica]|uniref:RNase H type-1 domain-containing protein n=1 Tax=Brassica cretica TaxID=69181 RepID=A0A8S9SSI0_BRACR|nr:hypothetical protein F2Q69_00034630 [Brassica cretica]